MYFEQQTILQAAWTSGASDHFPRFFSRQYLRVSVCDDTVSLGRLFLVRMVRVLLWQPGSLPAAGGQAWVWELCGPGGA
jgi:hypothetical protein